MGKKYTARAMKLVEVKADFEDDGECELHSQAIEALTFSDEVEEPEYEDVHYVEKKEP